MHLMLTDETNQQPATNVKFFVYGGLIFPVDRLVELHDAIEKIRQDAGYSPEDEFKFDTRSRPEHVSVEASRDAKRAVVDLCSSVGCKFIVHIILHAIIAKQDFNQQVRWAADYVIGRYNKFLNEEVKDNGICIVDNLPQGAEFGYLTTKFACGLVLPDGSKVQLDRIKLFASTRCGASHACSAMDIVLGSFRYAINNPKNVDAAREMFKKVSQMMWAIQKDDIAYVRDRGLIFRPPLESIRAPQYKAEYQELVKHLAGLANA
jgi:hypothetical protein